MSTLCSSLKRSFLIGWWVLAGQCLWAQEAKVQPPKPAPNALAQELKWLQAEAVKVTTATFNEETVSHAPATVRVVTQRQIGERGYRNLEDLMKDLPGFDIQNHSGVQDNIVAMRGVTGNNKFLILQNGIRISSAINSPQVPIRDNFPLYNVKQVEVLYGPASALYGADAFNGVINLITETAEGVNGGFGEFEAGEFGYYRGEFLVGKRLADWAAFSFGGTFLESDNPDLSKTFPSLFRQGDLVTFDGRTIVRAEDRKGYATPNQGFTTYAKLELGEDLVLGWNQSYYRVPSANNGLPDRVDYGRNPFIGHTLATAYGTYKFQLTDKLHGQVQTSYSFYEVDEQSKFVDIFTDFTDGFKYEKGERFQIEPHLTLELDKHAFTAGLNFEYFSSIPFTADLTTPYHPDKSPSDQSIFYPGTQNRLPVRFFDIEYYNVGGLIQAQSQWNSKFSSTVGLRVDENSDYGNTVNPRVGLVYELSEATTFKALYGRAFLAPSPTVRYRTFGSFTGQPNANGLYESFYFRVPNEDLKPERVQTAELGVSQKLGADFTVSLDTFYSQAKDLILAAPSQPVERDFIPGGVIFFTNHEANVGKVKAYGLDLTLDYERRFEKSRLDLWANFSYVDGELEYKPNGTHIDLPHTAREKVKFGLTYNWNDRFIFTPSAHWIGPTTGFQDDPAAPDFGASVPSYFLVNLYAEWRVRPKLLAIFARVTNLLDARIYHTDIGSTRNFFQAPQDPRWVMAGLRVSF